MPSKLASTSKKQTKYHPYNLKQCSTCPLQLRPQGYNRHVLTCRAKSVAAKALLQLDQKFRKSKKSEAMAAPVEVEYRAASLVGQHLPDEREDHRMELEDRGNTFQDPELEEPATISQPEVAPRATEIQIPGMKIDITFLFLFFLQRCYRYDRSEIRLYRNCAPPPQ